MADQEKGGVAVIPVPSSHAAKVQEYANSLMEEQTPDVEGYAALIKGVGGDVGGIRGGGIAKGPIVNAISGTNCSVSGPKLNPNDFDCGDDD